MTLKKSQTRHNPFKIVWSYGMREHSWVLDVLIGLVLGSILVWALTQLV